MRTNKGLLMIVILLILATFLTIWQDVSKPYHSIVVHFYFVVLIITAFITYKMIFYVTFYLIFMHIIFDTIQLESVPQHAIQESLVLITVAIVMYAIIFSSKRDALRYSNYIKASNVGTWEYHVETGQMIYNERWAEMLGYKLSELKPTTIETFKKLAHEQDTKEAFKQLDEVFSGQREFYDIKFRMKHKDGHFVWINDRGKIIEKDAQGQAKVLSGTHTDITKEVHLQQSLHMQNEKYKRLIDSTSDIIFEIDQDQTFLNIYGKWIEQSPLKLKDFFGKKAFELFDDETAKTHQVAFDKALKGEKTLFVWSYPIHDQTIYYHTSISPIESHDNKIIGAVGISRNITRLVENEKMIKHSKNLMTYIIEHASEAIAVHDKDLNYIYVSQDYLKQYHVTEKNIIGKHHYEVFPDLPEKWRQVHLRALKGEVIKGDKDYYYKEDGSYEVTRWECRPWYDENQEIGGIVIYTKVITEEVEIQNILEKRANDLYIQKQHIEATLLSIGDAVISTDQYGIITNCNKVAAKLLEQDPNDLIGCVFKDVFHLISDKDHKPLEDLVSIVIKHKKMIELDHHTILKSKSGKKHFIEDSASPILNEEKELVGVVIVFRDVTEKMRRHREIEYLSMHDFLTGLYNRRYFVESLHQHDFKKNLPLGLMMIDLNGLKILNDAYGHDYGDLALKMTADLLKEVFNEEQTVSRIGGDEFAVIIPHATEDIMNNYYKNIMKKLKNKKIKHIALSLAVGYELKHDINTDVDEVLRIAESHMYRHKFKESKKIRNKAIEAIFKSLIEQYPKEKEHAENVKMLASNVGKALKLSDADQSLLEMTAYYHDLGKIAIPSKILDKAYDELKDEEIEIMNTHVEVGYQILKSSEDYFHISEFVLKHHEAYNGKGYPNGLKENDIPLISRIVSLCSKFDHLLLHKNIDAALNEIVHQKKKLFCPLVVDTFINDVAPKMYKK